MSGRDLSRNVRGRRYRIKLAVTCDYLPLDAQLTELTRGLDVDVTLVGEPHGGRQDVELVGRANQLLVVLIRHTSYDLTEARFIWGTRELVERQSD